MPGPHQKKFSWSYFAIELLIVTSGVLIALALDQWIDSQRERKEEEVHLRAVRTELKQIVDALEAEITLKKAVSASANRILAMFASDANPHPEELDVLLNDLLYLSFVYVPTGAVESIIASGKLRIISNEKLRFFLAGLPERLDDIKEAETDDYRLAMDYIMPFMSENSNLTQLADVISGPPGAPGDKPFFSYPSGKTRDHTLLMRNPKFQNLVIQKLFRQNNMVAAYENLRPQLVAMIGLIDSELTD